MTRTLRISDDLALPLEAATRRMAILGMSGSGKSSLAVALAEAMHDAHIPWVAIDGKGDWWGVRSDADGKSGGLPIPIFGGLHGDVPLEPTAGAFIGELIVDKRLTCVLDISEFPDRQQMWRFMADLGETLLRKNREALHLFLEEADDYIPQRTAEKGQLPRCLGVWQRVIKRGRFRGIGSTQISQRNASLNKDTLYQAEVLIALRATGKGDRNAVAGWVEHHSAASSIVESLPSLADGEGWVSSPAWLRTTKRVRFRRRRTFDSGATPVLIGGGRRPAATLADVDLGAIQTAMAETIERAKADDPRELRKQIAAGRELQRELEIRNGQLVRELEAERAKVKEVAVLKPKDIEKLGKIADTLHATATKASEAATRIAAAIGSTLPVVVQHPTEPLPPHARRLAQATLEAFNRGHLPGPREHGRQLQRPVPHDKGGDGQVGSGGLRRILVALAQRPQGLTNRQIGIRAGLSSQSGTFANYMSKARGNGWIVDDGATRLITLAGRDALGKYEPLPTGRALLEYWLGQLGQSGASRMLAALAEAYPTALSNDEIGAAAGISHASGTFANYMSRLRGLELIIGGGRGLSKASDELFE